MSVERKSLLIELFVQSHLILSSITEDRLKERSRKVLEYDFGERPLEIQSERDYLHYLEYVKDLVVRALIKYQKEVQEDVQLRLSTVTAEIQNAASGNELFGVIENMPK